MEEQSGAGTLVLATAKDVEQAYVRATLLGRRPVDEVQVALPWLSEHERQSAARRVRQNLNDCGCRTGELVLALVGLTVFLGPALLRLDRPGWPVVVLLLVVAAVGGKLLGLALSRRRLRLDLRRLSSGAAIKKAGGGHDGSNRVP